MVLRQCLACNTTILGTLQICTCGHVFEETRQIGGKRFSEYRANLYSRLEAKRLKLAKDESKAQSDTDDTDSNDGDWEKQVVVKPKKSRPTPSFSSKPRRRKGKRQRRHAAVTQSEDHQGNKRNNTLFQSPEEGAARLSRALQEINRRLMGQSMLWLL